MPVTIKDIAKEAGVSANTVSFALRGQKPCERPLSVQAIQHVKAIAGNLGYHLNHIAVSLVAQKTHTIGVLLRSFSFGSEVELREATRSI